MYQIGTDATMRTLRVGKAKLSRKEKPWDTQKLAIHWYFAQLIKDMETGHGISSTRFVFSSDEKEKSSST